MTSHCRARILVNGKRMVCCLLTVHTNLHLAFRGPYLVQWTRGRRMR